MTPRSQQIFQLPEVEREKDHQRDHHKPVPPPEVGCPDDYVWDLTLYEPLGGLPSGTVLCSFSDVLNVGEYVQIEGTGEPLTYQVLITRPDPSTGICSSPNEAQVSPATASSGNPPALLEIGDAVCVITLNV
jgi:hypothetical protein